MATRRLWREALQLSKVFRSGPASGSPDRCVGSRHVVLYIRCVSNCPQYCPPSNVGCYFSARDRDGGTEREWRKGALFASLGVLSLTLCSSVREDGTNCLVFHSIRSSLAFSLSSSHISSFANTTAPLTSPVRYDI